MFKIAICDDELMFRNKEIQAIQEIMNRDYSNLTTEIVKFKNGHSLIDYYANEELDIIFLDIELGLEDGFDIAKKLVNLRKNTKIVFVTSHENLVFESFVCRPIGFIRKRIFEQELELVMSQAMSSLIEDQIIIEVGEGRNTYRLQVSSIRIIETFNHNITIELENTSIKVRDKLSRFETSLLNSGFVKASRGCAVNMRFIKKIENGQLNMLDGTQILISRSRINEVEKCYKHFITFN